ncbi:MAG TPA: hypothetical protein VD978_23020 [Azospirillum sp.]|nr:hypothetical protein [Azospirillum sp.]
MRDGATALGYALTVALAAIVFYAGFTTLLDLRADPLAYGAVALCGTISGAVAWPRTHEEFGRSHVALQIGSRTAIWFYLLFTTATVTERFPEYFGEIDGGTQTLMTMLFSLPALIVASLGAMIYATFGAAFFISAFIAGGWVRLARRAAPPRPPPA